jgi:hypothetical protein
MDKRVSDILEIAIKREEGAYDFYMDIHGKVADPGVKETLEFIAGEEKKHKAFLVNYRDGNLGAKGLRILQNLRSMRIRNLRMSIWWHPTGNGDLITSIRSWRTCIQMASCEKCC